MDTLPNLNLINKCQEPNQWDLTNKVLYELCLQNFKHDTYEKIIAKTLIIGRSYSVALERRKNKLITEINDNFYTDKIAPFFKNSELDNLILYLQITGEPAESTLHMQLNAHWALTDMIFRITKLNKRSFSSKYLHFHLPSHFFIYDTRAVKALKLFIKEVPQYLQYLTEKEKIDKEYCKFYSKCFHLQKLIKKDYGVELTTRHIDKMLIEVANENAIKVAEGAQSE